MKLESIWNQDLDQNFLVESVEQNVKQVEEMKAQAQILQEKPQSDRKNKNPSKKFSFKKSQEALLACGSSCDFDQPGEIKVEEKKIDLKSTFNSKRGPPKFTNSKIQPKEVKTEMTSSTKAPKFSAFIESKRKEKSLELEEDKYPSLPCSKVNSFTSSSAKLSGRPFQVANTYSYNQIEEDATVTETLHMTQKSMKKCHSVGSENSEMPYDYTTSYQQFNSSGSVGSGIHSQQISDEMRMYYYELGLYETLTSEIDKEVSQISTMVKMIQKYREDIKEEIELVAYETFNSSHKDIQAYIYGSVATELALPESDVDIVITGVNSFGSKKNHQTNITMLHESLQEYFDGDVMIKCQKILNTQVPIIKMALNLSEYYDMYTKKGYKALPYVNFDSIDTINPHLKVLSVDISLSDSLASTDHLGIQQSLFVKQKLQEFPVIRPVCLILKKLLIKNNFNDPYTGGLGSFSLFLMILTAMYQERVNAVEAFHSESAYAARLFAWFLSYYGS